MTSLSGDVFISKVIVRMGYFCCMLGRVGSSNNETFEKLCQYCSSTCIPSLSWTVRQKGLEVAIVYFLYHIILCNGQSVEYLKNEDMVCILLTTTSLCKWDILGT